MSESIPPIRPIFIVGTGRSGTTLLRALLNAHPNIHLTQEAGFYRWGAPARLRACRTAAHWFEGYQRTASFRLLRLDPAPIAAAIPDGLSRQGLAQVHTKVMQAAAARHGRARIGDKTPLHALHLPAIFEDFPEARVVHLVRAPLPTAASLMRMPWGTTRLVMLSHGYRTVAAAVPAQDPRVLRLRLEDLLDEPELRLRDVLAHVGEPWHPNVLDHVGHGPQEDLVFPWFSSAQRPLAAPQQAPVDLPPAVARLMWDWTRHAAQAYGYARPALPPVGTALRWSTALGDIGGSLAEGWRLWRTQPQTRRPEDIDARSQLEWLLGLNRGPRVDPGWRGVPEWV